eukprot:tig00020603_g11754.t1
MSRPSASNAIADSFPDCRAVAEALEKCSSRHKGPDGMVCDQFRTQLQFCILRSLCPAEGDALNSCSETFTGKGAGVRGFLPKDCLHHVRAFEACLERRQEELSDQLPIPPPPKPRSASSTPWFARFPPATTITTSD